ncbi:MAG TPA: CPBP family intramembrane glutamic endopeptidase, partial [Planctomycetota bacterium]|nr:CPBP family intramembrane glutamic endopeptidase [Planctomycetota bacterium]
MKPKPLARAIQFVALTFALSWGIVGLSYIAGAEQSTIARFGVRLSIMFVPMGVAIILQKALYREAVFDPLGVSFQVNRWFAVGWLLPPVLAAATIAPALALPGVKLLYSPGHLLDQVRPLLTDDQYAKAYEQLSALPFAALVVQSILAAIVPNSIAAFGEELGWRGFLHRALEPLGFWRSSLLIGAIWGLWHAPIILLGHNYPRHPVAGAFMMTVV